MVAGLSAVGSLVSCGGGTSAPAPSAPDPAPFAGGVIAPFSGDELVEHRVGGARPARLLVPAGAGPSTPLPLVVNLHGFGSDGRQQDLYFGLSPRAAEAGFAVVSPDGTQNSRGLRFWNATDYCCDLEYSGVDDVAYLADLVREAERFFAVRGVFLAGMSNGGFMAYRAACDGVVPGLTGILVVAGSSWYDAERCGSPSAISVLHLHGTEDETIRFDGWTPQSGPTGDAGHPGAEEVVRRWAERAGCDPTPVESPNALDLDFETPGAETRIRRYTGCSGGRSVELWVLNGARHVPDFGAGLGRRFTDWIAGR